MNGGIGLDRLSLNQATVKYLGLADAVALCARHDIPAIGLWRDRVAEAGLASAAAVRCEKAHASCPFKLFVFPVFESPVSSSRSSSNRSA